MTLLNNRHFTLLMMLFLATSVFSQGHLENVEKFTIGDQKHLISSIEVSPDGKTLAVATTQSHPIYMVDLQTNTVRATFETEGYYAGPIITFSKSGRYMLLEQQFYTNWNVNKDKAARYEIKDSQDGITLMRLDNVQDAQISPDETRFAVIKKDELIVYALPGGEVLMKETIEGLKNALCYSADGKFLYVTHKLTKDQAADMPTIRSDKHAIKHAVKFQEGVSEYDAEKLLYKRMFYESFDNVYDLKVNHDGSKIYTFSRLSSRVNKANWAQGHVLMFNIETGMLERGGFVTNMLLTDIGASNNGSYFGLVSSDGRSKLPIVQIGDPATSDILTYFQIDKGIWEGIKDGEYQGAQVSFDFSKDEKFIYVSSGNVIYKWEIAI